MRNSRQPVTSKEFLLNSLSSFKTGSYRLNRPINTGLFLTEWPAFPQSPSHAGKFPSLEKRNTARQGGPKYDAAAGRTRFKFLFATFR